MSPGRRRASDEFFRPTAAEPAPTGPTSRTSVTTPRAGTPRQRHDAKITVYLSNDELLDLERLRLDLRADHGIVVDRGRLVREAIALALTDVADRGDAGELVRRLRG